MSTRTEERLSAALAARAEQVRPEDLGPVERPGTRRRPRAGYALAAAALAAVVASPFLVDGLRSGPHPVPAPATQVPSPSVTPRTDAAEPAGRVVVRRQRADVDGDGQPDEVRLTYRVGGTTRLIPVRVAVTVASGGTTSDTVRLSEPPVLDPPRDIDGDGREVVVTRSETGDADTPQVFAYRQGRIQHLSTAYGAPGLYNAVDAGGRVIRFWWDRQDRLFSVRGVAATRNNHATVAVYRWTVRAAPGHGPVLGATRLPGTQCFDLERGTVGGGC